MKENRAQPGPPNPTGQMIGPTIADLFPIEPDQQERNDQQTRTVYIYVFEMVLGGFGQIAGTDGANLCC